MITFDVKIDVKNIPEAIWELRREMARILRAQAEREASAYVIERLRTIADTFEAGISHG